MGGILNLSVPFSGSPSGTPAVAALSLSAGAIADQDAATALAPTGTAPTGGTAPYTYAWTLAGRPAGSTKVTGDITDVTAIDFTAFTPDTGGDYVFEVTVTDDNGVTAKDSTTVTVGQDGFIKIDLSTWTLTAGTTAGLVVSVSSTQVVIADLAANTSTNSWSMFTGIAIATNHSYEFKYRRLNPGQFDRVGMCFGLQDTDMLPRFCAGTYEDTGVSLIKQHFGANNAWSWTADINTNGNVIHVSTDNSGTIISGTSVSLDASGDWNSIRNQAAPDVTTDGNICGFVRHGTIGYGGNSTIQYELWLRILPI